MTGGASRTSGRIPQKAMLSGVNFSPASKGPKSPSMLIFSTASTSVSCNLALPYVISQQSPAFEALILVIEVEHMCHGVEAGTPISSSTSRLFVSS